VLTVEVGRLPSVMSVIGDGIADSDDGSDSAWECVDAGSSRDAEGQRAGCAAAGSADVEALLGSVASINMCGANSGD